MERDVVCGMQVDPAKAAATTEYNGKIYYFCAKVCKTKFDADPAKYVKAWYRKYSHRSLAKKLSGKHHKKHNSFTLSNFWVPM